MASFKMQIWNEAVQPIRKAISSERYFRQLKVDLSVTSHPRVRLENDLGLALINRSHVA